ncbi:DUF2129 domain-containing protein [Streptococcus hillyeri]|uniref:UPF0298 protein EAF07_03805 n=1 Tax=Streptococcus hillyeri TaxID=2282420 RepID=A0A3L9DTE1_9STRE|nr:DUF2129 domain-containing protein [Streptococcus hillyeri]RLY04205.1 DUF2129 domain-containing protein [Streptococcus hillyeri]
MFEKQERVSLAVYLYYNRDARKLNKFGETFYHSKKMRYVLLYINAEDVNELTPVIEKQKFVKRVLPSHLHEIDHNFVGNLFRTEKD